MTDERKDAPVADSPPEKKPGAAPEQKPDAGADGGTPHVRTKVRKKAPKKFFWNRRKVEDIQASTTAILTAEEPGARLRNILMIVTGCLVLAGLVLLVAFPPKSNLPAIETLYTHFKRAGVPYRVAKVRIGGSNVTHLVGDVPVTEWVGGELVMVHVVKLRDLTPLKGIPIQGLYVKNSNATDIAVLHGMPLRCLLLNNTEVSDLSPVRGMPLRSLDIRGTPVTDLAPLQGMSLKYLGFDASLATNGLDAIREMKSLELINKLHPDEFWPRYDRGDFRASADGGGGSDQSVSEQ